MPPVRGQPSKKHQNVVYLCVRYCDDERCNLIDVNVFGLDNVAECGWMVAAP